MKRIMIWAAVLLLLGTSVAQGASVPHGASMTWTWANPRPQANDLWSVAYGGGLFVAVGDGGSILTSADGGTSWTLQEWPTMTPLRSGLTGPEAEARLWANSVLDPDRPATRAEAARLLLTLLR